MMSSAMMGRFCLDLCWCTIYVAALCSQHFCCLILCHTPVWGTYLHSYMTVPYTYIYNIYLYNTYIPSSTETREKRGTQENPVFDSKTRVLHFSGFSPGDFWLNCSQVHQRMSFKQSCPENTNTFWLWVTGACTQFVTVYEIFRHNS